MAANDTRVVAIEIKQNTATLKAAVDALKTAVDAVHAVTDTWVVNGLDAALPADVDVKAQMAAYDSINAYINKPSNALTDSIAAVNAAV